MGSPYFDFNSIVFGQDEEDPLGLNKFAEEERLRKEEEERKYKESLLGRIWEPTKWFFDDAVLKPLADAVRDPGIRATMRATAPGFKELEQGAGLISGAGALAGMGMTWDPKDPNKYRAFPENWQDILREETQEGLPTAIEQVAPVDVVTGGLGLGVKGLSAIPKAVRAAKAASTVGNIVDASEGAFGAVQTGLGIAQQDPTKIATGLLRAGMGGAGAASSLMPDIAPRATSEFHASETIDELPDLKLDEVAGYEPARSPSEGAENPLSYLLEEPTPTGPSPAPEWSTGFKDNVQQLVDEITPEAEKILGMSPEFGGEGLGKIQVVFDINEGGGGAYFDLSKDPNVPHTIALNPHLMKGKSADTIIKTILHEITHKRTPRHEMGVIEGERLAARPFERTGSLPLGGGTPHPDAYEIVDESLRLADLPPESRAEVSPYILDAHTRANMIARGKITPDEYNILGDEQALFHNPEIQEKLAAFRERSAALEEATNPPPPTYEENLRAIREGRPFPSDEKAAAPTEVGKAEQVEYNALSEYARQQDALLKEASQKFSTAKTEAEKSAASKEFQSAKAEKDRVTARIKQLEKAGVESRKPNVDELIAQAKRESAERKVEPAKNQVEVDKAHERLLEEVTEEPTPKSENVVSTPANNLRKLLSGLELTRFNVHSLTKELKARGLDVPEELDRQLPELVKELKDKGWVNEKLGGTYTLLAAPGKDIAGIRGKGKPIEVSNIQEGLKESIEATRKEAPTVDIKAEPASTPEVKPGQMYYDEIGRRWDIRKVEGDKVYLERGLGGAGVRKQVVSTDEVIARRGKVGAPIEEGKGPEDIEISTEGLPEKQISLEDQMKAKLTPEEIKAIGDLFGTTKKKGTKDIPEEVLMAQKAAIRARAKGEKVTEGPPTETVAEPGEGPGRNYKVTLSDGSEHTVKAASAEEAKMNAEDVLREHQSTKTVDKVEESLSSLEKAAKYEIEPEKAGREQAAEDIKDVKKAQSEEVKEFAGIVKETERLEKEQFRERKAAKSEEVKETTKLSKEEEKLRTAQRKEKFKRKPFLVNLSNGRVVTVNARNEATARFTVEQAIKNKKSPVKIASVAEKPSALESAITGYGKTVEESGFLQSPLVRTLNSMKSLAYGGDVGHMLRQGKQINADLLFSKHWREVPKQLGVVYKSAKSQDYFDKFHEKLYSDPDIAMMVDNFNLDMPGLGKNLKEEAFYGGGLVEKAPIIGKFYARPSERAYTAGLNFLRGAETKKLIENLRKRGLTPENAPEKYRAVAKAVNIISQRGDFNPAYQKIFSDASAIYGAPRAKAARLQNAFELFRGGEAGDVVRTTAAKTLAFNAGLYGLLMATTGAVFITDPEKSDFGKIRVNDKISIDPWMGLGVTARTVAKLVTGKSKSPYTGSTRTVSPSEAVMQEFLGGIAPGIKLTWEALSGKDIRGYQVNRLKSLLNVTPMTAKSVAELLGAAEIEDALLLSLLQIGGEGVDVFDYEKARAEETQLKKERGLATRGSKGKKRPKFPF